MRERPPKNRHHYVPKFYLRNFGNSDYSISTLSCTAEKYIENASIKSMCQHEKLYGKTDELEDIFMLSEGIFAKIIKSTITNNKIPKENVGDYLFFILQSNARTLKQAKLIEYKMTISAQTYLNMNLDFKKKFPDFNYDNLKLNYEVPNHIPLSIVNDMFNLTKDLDYCLLLNKSNSREFITSDEPVAIDNYLAKKLGYKGGTGFANAGILIYFPISPKHCILFFDSDVYDIPYDEYNNLTIHTAKEIDKLNRYMYLNSFSNIFFSNSVKENYIIKKVQQSFKIKKPSEQEIIEASVVQVPLNEKENLIVVKGDHPEELLSLNFIKINKYGKKYTPTNRSTFYLRKFAKEILDEKESERAVILEKKNFQEI